MQTNLLTISGTDYEANTFRAVDIFSNEELLSISDRHMCLPTASKGSLVTYINEHILPKLIELGNTRHLPASVTLNVTGSKFITVVKVKFTDGVLKVGMPKRARRLVNVQSFNSKEGYATTVLVADRWVKDKLYRA